MKTLLVTFGCSWTFGVGVGYVQGMSHDEYIKIAWDHKRCGEFSFRGLLSKKYNLTNKNFAEGASSNQRQFRYAREFFCSQQIKQLKNDFDKIIVLWGITSTARNEMWSLEKGELVNLFYGRPDLKLVKNLIKFSYNHDHEVRLLKTEMDHWNAFFKSLDIDNLWFDTFNHHNYNLLGIEFKQTYETVKGPDWPSWEDFFQKQFDTLDIDQKIQDEITDIDRRWPWSKIICPVENLMFSRENPRDLLSKLAIQNGCQNLDDYYHESNWKIDSNRIEYLINKSLLTPYSKHPTDQGHAQIADIMSLYIEKLL